MRMSRSLRAFFLGTFQDMDNTAYTVCRGETFKKTVLFRVVREIRVLKKADGKDF